MEMLKTFLFEEDGQTLVEYALILVLIAIAAVAAMTVLQGGISTRFNNIASAVAP